MMSILQIVIFPLQEGICNVYVIVTGLKWIVTGLKWIVYYVLRCIYWSDNWSLQQFYF